MGLIDKDAIPWDVDGVGEIPVITKEEIDEMPTVDAVPVIWCKDCKLWMKNPYRESSVFGLCFKHKDVALATDETDWCSWAERKEE